MKKLKLKLDGIKEMLSKEQMKKINGGYDLQDVRCILVYHDPGSQPSSPIIWSEYRCMGTTDTSACAALAIDSCHRSYDLCYTDSCSVF